MTGEGSRGIQVIWGFLCRIDDFRENSSRKFAYNGKFIRDVCR